jgi:hypothetical protein
MATGTKEDCENFHLFRYDDCWWALWKNPPALNLGRVLSTERELRLFLGGNLSMGVNIGPPDINAK